ncbi:winged helix-turn-helix transcriptional regulator [Halorubrum sp. DTA98]|uniref:winged helix-turn-helix transcriptional regulator n=1 Tax=Halorubrum sp. DTA98 TaxID=3402163 RepID=UPI003AACDD46
MPDTRTRIKRHVRDTPGVHFNRVSRDLDIATGQTQYHLRRLVTDGELVVERIGGKSHYFETTFDPWDRRLIAYLQRETPRAIVVRLYAEGPTRQTTLASELDVARSTIAWHVSNLVEHGIVTKSVDHPMTLTLVDAERTGALLDEVSPTLPESVVDRFIRTVDELLD